MNHASALLVAALLIAGSVAFLGVCVLRLVAAMRMLTGYTKSLAHMLGSERLQRLFAKFDAEVDRTVDI